MTAGNVSSTYNFDNTYTRAADTTAVFPTNNIGPSLAALMLGIPTSVTIGQNAPISMSNPFYGGFIQDTWRARSNLTLNFGLRYEFEGGIRESEDRWLTEFDPDARAGDHRPGAGRLRAQSDPAAARERVPRAGRIGLCRRARARAG